jgi:hypothetical protein
MMVKTLHFARFLAFSLPQMGIVSKRLLDGTFSEVTIIPKQNVSTVFRLYGVENIHSETYSLLIILYIKNQPKDKNVAGRLIHDSLCEKRAGGLALDY